MPRTFVGGFLLLFGAAMLTIAAAGTNAAGLSIVETVNDFFGVTSMRMSEDEIGPSGQKSGETAASISSGTRIPNRMSPPTGLIAWYQAEGNTDTPTNTPTVIPSFTPSSTPTPSGVDQPILFVTNRDGNTEIYKMSVDGSNQQRLTSSTENESNALWSPDGQKIVFSRNINSTTNQIWSMNADGSGQTLISDATGYNLPHEWSPNGQKILFSIGDPNADAKLWVMNADGSNKTQLSDPPMYDHSATWSPDGSKIAFGRCGAGFICDVFIMNADGSNPVNLTSANPHDDDAPAWTPDGSKIVFGAQSNPNDYNVYVMNADGSNRQPLTNGVPPQLYLPGRISPNGSKVAMRSVSGAATTYEIATVGIDGTNLTTITNNSVLDLFSRWSPDSSKIAFRSRRDAATDEIYIMNFDGSGVVRLTSNSATDGVTDWRPTIPAQTPTSTATITPTETATATDTPTATPTATVTATPTPSLDVKLVYVTDRDSSGSFEIYTMDSNGANPLRLTNNTFQDLDPEWSPDGTKIAFSSFRDGNREIYVMDADGGNPTRLTNNSFFDSEPTWSPDGTKIAFRSARNGNADIYVMDADGTDEVRLTTHPNIDSQPSWSPAGSSIAFIRTDAVGAEADVWTMDTDGGNQTQLTHTAGDDAQPDWSPGGSYILFTSFRDGNFEIYRMTAGGADETRLTNSSGEDTQASWAPDGTKISFTTNRDGNYEVYIMNPDGSTPQRLTDIAGTDAQSDWQTASTSTFSNTAQITGNDNGPGEPYPSEIGSGRQAFSGTITKVTVDLVGLSHPNPEDLDIMLVGPGGHTALIMSDAGGISDVLNVDITLDDQAATGLPNAGQIVSGTFLPTNFDATTDTFPAPAPTPQGSALSVFNGTDPNGIWSLYIRDDAANKGVGTISGGWALHITTNTGATVSGTITYGNATGAPNPRFVSNVTITGSGSPTVATTTAAPGVTAGQYILTNFGAGSYTVTPTKTGGVNSITSFDAARISQHVVGINVLTGSQLVVADVSGNSSVTSFDAGMVAKFVAGPPYMPPGVGATAEWRFTPVSRNYSSLTSIVEGQDFTALLMGEVSGNWANTGARSTGSRQLAVGGRSERSIVLDIPSVAGSVDKEIVVPVNVQSIANKGVISYELDVRYDPSVIQPAGNAIDLRDTSSRGLSVVANATEPGLLRVVVYGPLPISDDGVLLNLRFTAVGLAGAISPLTFERMMFNDGEPRIAAADGSVTLF